MNRCTIRAVRTLTGWRIRGRELADELIIRGPIWFDRVALIP
jgi:hypothetical protein